MQFPKRAHSFDNCLHIEFVPDHLGHGAEGLGGPHKSTILQYYIGVILV